MSRFTTGYQRLVRVIDRFPLQSFFIALAILFGMLGVAHFWQKPSSVQQEEVVEAKIVQTYAFGESPKLSVSARIEKSGVISIYAQAPGIVQKIHVQEGKKVFQAQTLISLSTNYQGGNAASLSRQIAQKNFTFSQENFELQKEVINRQKDLASKGNLQAAEIRELTRQSLGDTRSLISQNEEILSVLDTQIRFLESNNVNGSNDAALASARQGRLAASSGLASLKSTLRTVEYQSDDTKTPAQITDMSKEVTLKQLELQEKSLVLAKDLSGLNLRLARISEGLMYPATPCAGLVERVYVKVGQSVSPGTLLATIKANQGENSAVILVPSTIAKQVSSSEVTEFSIGTTKISLYPRYISSEATDGTLYSLIYSIPATYSASLTNATSVAARLPLGASSIITDELSIPLDAVYQTQEKAYVYILHNEGEKRTAKTVEVALGDVSGRFVQVLSGLSSTDVIILSRTVQDGDQVKTE